MVGRARQQSALSKSFLRRRSADLTRHPAVKAFAAKIARLGGNPAAYLKKVREEGVGTPGLMTEFLDKLPGPAKLRRELPAGYNRYTGDTPYCFGPGIIASSGIDIEPFLVSGKIRAGMPLTRIGWRCGFASWKPGSHVRYLQMPATRLFLILLRTEFFNSLVRARRAYLDLNKVVSHRQVLDVTPYPRVKTALSLLDAHEIWLPEYKVEELFGIASLRSKSPLAAHVGALIDQGKLHAMPNPDPDDTILSYISTWDRTIGSISS